MVCSFPIVPELPKRPDVMYVKRLAGFVFSDAASLALVAVPLPGFGPLPIPVIPSPIAFPTKPRRAFFAAVVPRFPLPFQPTFNAAKGELAYLGRHFLYLVSTIRTLAFDAVELRVLFAPGGKTLSPFTQARRAAKRIFKSVRPVCLSSHLLTAVRTRDSYGSRQERVSATSGAEPLTAVFARRGKRLAARFTNAGPVLRARLVAARNGAKPDNPVRPFHNRFTAVFA